MGVTSPAAPGAELLIGRTLSRYIHRLGTSRASWSPPRVPTGALSGPVDPLSRPGGRRGATGIAVLGLPVLALQQHVFIAGFLAGFFVPYSLPSPLPGHVHQPQVPIWGAYAMFLLDRGMNPFPEGQFLLDLSARR